MARSTKYTEVCSMRACEHAPRLTGRLRLCDMHIERIIDLLELRPLLLQRDLDAQAAAMRRAPNGDRLLALVGGAL